MIDFDDLVAALRFYERNDYLLHDDADELIDRLRQAEKDAARYRWVRSASIAELNEFCNMIRPHRDGFVDDAIIEDDMQCSK